MRLKRYEAPTLPEALRIIKKDLGPDAIIVHSQQIRPKGLWGIFGRPVFEVIAASDGDLAPRTVSRMVPKTTTRPPDPSPSPATQPTPRTSGGPGVGRDIGTRSVSPQPLQPTTAKPAVPPVPARPVAAEPTRSALAQLASAPATHRGVRVSPSPLVGEGAGGEGEESPSLDLSLNGVQRDLTELKGAVLRLATQSHLMGIYKFAPTLVNSYQALLEQELDSALAQQIIVAIREELSDRALNDPRAVEDGLRRHVQRLLLTSGPLQPRGTQPRVLFLIGPTGVGKTTTLAKLAANLALDRHRVTLVTTDTFRIAAIPQLETYAEIIGVPVEVAYTPDDLAAIVGRQRGMDFILVDSPGRSPHCVERIEPLRQFVGAVPGCTVYLTISATTKYRDMLDVAEQFGIIPYDGLLFTKLDETTTYGPLVNLANQTRQPLTYLTTGQNVPTDIEVATRERLVCMLTEASADAAR
ncbi:MAG: flagellar biosynthesis protein FlhF [Chloroflexi bacterium]|nr:flagellar biosynthesis protein FlhF [Chloroflexota bacterium]